jgi:hypothetical protein
MKRLIFLSLLIALCALAQNPATPLPTTATNPNGQVCQSNAILNYVPSGVIYTCQNGFMAVAGTGPWTRTGNTISPTNAGDSVAIPTTLPGSLPTSTGPSGVLVPVLISTSGPVSAVATGFYINNASGALTYTLPVITSANVGLQLCFRNAVTRTGAITLTAPASTYIDVAGAVGSAAGNLVSGGALGDAACVVAIDTTHYYAYVGNGTWTGS